jgi:uncharacterized protein YjbI with pentapeptide repeats
MEQEPNPPQRWSIREVVPAWRPTREQRLWTIRIAIVLVVILGILTLIGLPFGITLWDWAQLLIVPAVLTGGGIWFNRQQQQRALEVAEKRAQDEALQAYLDRIGNLLFDKDKPLQQQSGDTQGVVDLARAHTLTILRRLDPSRKRSVLDFLYEAQLIKGGWPNINLGSPDFIYSAADLSGADLRGAVLRSAYLSGIYGPNLTGADLRGADLKGANLGRANLRGANLSGAVLSDENGKTDLVDADLRGSYLIGTNFRGAILRDANLSGSHFRWPEGSSTQQYDEELRAAGLPDERIKQAIRGPTDLKNADLGGVQGVTNEQLHNLGLPLEGATMPSGQKYEEWLKDKEEGGEAGENGRPS